MITRRENLTPAEKSSRRYVLVDNSQDFQDIETAKKSLTKAKKAYAKNVVEATIHKEDWVRSQEKHGKHEAKLRGKLRVLEEVAAKQESLDQVVTDQKQSADEIVSEFQKLREQRKEDKKTCESLTDELSKTVNTNVDRI